MKYIKDNEGLTVAAVTSPWVVYLSIDIDDKLKPGLLGFSIFRTALAGKANLPVDETDGYFLKGYKVFPHQVKQFPPGSLIDTNIAPIQKFQWGDYTAKPGVTYAYKVTCMLGQPQNLRDGTQVIIKVMTPNEDSGVHAVYFNRGVAGSQAFAKKFPHVTNTAALDNDPAAKAWLARGLDVALENFITRSNDTQAYELKCAFYEFTYEPVMTYLVDVQNRGYNVQIIYDANAKTNRGVRSMAGRLGFNLNNLHKRTHAKISHDKFIVFLRNGSAEEVWTGSTNITPGGIFGQANVGHIIRDSATASKYNDFWDELVQDPKTGLNEWNMDNTPLPNSIQAVGDDEVLPVFSPRETPASAAATLGFYQSMFKRTTSLACFTAAFGVNAQLADTMTDPSAKYLTFILMESKGKTWDQLVAAPNVKPVLGAYLKSPIYEETIEGQVTRFLKERLVGRLNSHARYIHLKFLLSDPLKRNAMTATGSANFSAASVNKNDENMVIVTEKNDSFVADTYFCEFMRLYEHFKFRDITISRSTADSAQVDPNLKTDVSWQSRFYVPKSTDFEVRKRLVDIQVPAAKRRQ